MLQNHSLRLVLTNINFQVDRVILQVETPKNLSPEQRATLTDLLDEIYPNIKSHACKNSHGPAFADCLPTTSLPHILEHCILEECTSENAKQKVSDIENEKRLFVGKTTNLGAGLAKIELKYYDDILMLHAIKRATKKLNSMLKQCEG